MIKSILSLLFVSGSILLIGSGCAQKQLTINGMICPEGHTEERVKADFAACRYYDLKDADKASMPAMSIECQECLEKKGYTIEK